MTKYSLYLLVTLILGPAALCAQGWIAASGSRPAPAGLNRPEGQAGPILRKPFSGTEVRHTLQILGDGTRVEHSEAGAFYRDGEGRMRVEGAERILIYDPAAGATFELDPRTKTYFRTEIPADSAFISIGVAGNQTTINWSTDSQGIPTLQSRALVRAAARPVTEGLPAQIVNGVLAKGSRITFTIPTGTFGNDREIKIVNERWYSDDLKVLVKSSNSDPRFGISTYELTKISQAPPSPALFEVPAGYTLQVRKHFH